MDMSLAYVDSSFFFSGLEIHMTFFFELYELCGRGDLDAGLPMTRQIHTHLHQTGIQTEHHRVRRELRDVDYITYSPRVKR